MISVLCIKRNLCSFDLHRIRSKKDCRVSQSAREPERRELGLPGDTKE